MEVIVMKEGGKERSAMVAGVIGPGISPFTGDGLDEAFSSFRSCTSERACL
jgi:hypothetical protein